jgi:hypothetical protein
MAPLALNDGKFYQGNFYSLNGTSVWWLREIYWNIDLFLLPP